MAGLISPATLEQVRSASDIVDVIGAYVPLKRAGANFVALCPFHKEKTPSFNVNPNKQIFYCFGCHKGGDVFAFVKEFENIHFTDAVRRLAERAKIPLQMDNDPGQQQTRHLKDHLLQIHEQITQRWQNALANEAAGQAARDYLAKRGVSADAVKLFRLGCAPDVWDDTVNWSKGKSYEPALMEQAGLILRKEGGDHYYDRFRGRLIFPICDEQGRVIGFSGRVLDAEAKTAKYVNSPETPIFTKGKVFFGLDKSKRALLDAESAIVCEGQLDLIACYMGGVQNIVAPQGTALTAEHARILKRYVDEVVLCFDSDNAGQNAAVRSLDSLLASGLAIRVAVVPAPHDPDSFIKESGAAAFRELVEKAAGFFDYYLNRLCQTNELTSDKGRLTVLQEMAAAVHKTGNTVLIDTYARKTAYNLGVSADSVLKEFNKIRASGMQKIEQEESGEDTAGDVEGPRTQEFCLLKIVLENDDQMDWATTYLDTRWIAHPATREIIIQRLKLHKEHAWAGMPQFVSQLEGETAKKLVSEALGRPLILNVDGLKIPRGRPFLNPIEQLNGVVLELRNKFLDGQISELTKRLSLPELDDAGKLELIRQQQALRQLKHQPLSPLGGGAEEPF